ncbi:MAG: response regulator [Kofleriaceae bacterium]
MTVEPTAIAIARRGGSVALVAVVERLRAGGIEVTVTDELGAAAALALEAALVPCILLDLDGATDEVEDRRRAADEIRAVSAAIPHALPIAITGHADALMVAACMRAGAGDVLDLQLEGTGNAPALLGHVWERQRDATRTARVAGELRAVIEDLLKALIRTERRSLALEDQIEPPPLRDPAVLIVEHDREIADLLAERLENAGITSYAYISGEDAVRQAARLAVDLAVIAAQLPGIDGLETIRQLREQAPGLPTFLLTSVADPGLAARAAELGAVGFVEKPLVDAGKLVARLAALAREGLTRNREQTYLERIKERHEHVLARYRSLPRDA